jgi:hypothetical protein
MAMLRSNRRNLSSVFTRVVTRAATGLALLLTPAFAAAAPTYVEQAAFSPDPGDVLEPPANFQTAVDGSTAIVTSDSLSAAYIYVRSGNTWNLQATLRRPNPQPDEEYFGTDVAIDGNTAVITTSARNNSAAPLVGQADVFVRSGTSWTHHSTLLATGEDQFFGHSVSLSGDTLAIGASTLDDVRGVIYVFTRSAGVWTQQTRFGASDGSELDMFGTSLALQGTTLLIGAPGYGASDHGTAYVYTGSGATWTEQTKLFASDAPSDEQLGINVALDGNTAVLASRNLGRALVFVGSGSTWTQQATLPSPNSASGHREVAISGNLAVASDPQSGIATFRRAGVTWSAESTVVPADGSGARPVDAVAIDGATLVTAAPEGDREDGGRGFIYVSGNAPTNIALSATSIAENKPAGTLIGNLSSTDPDSGETFTYTLVPGTGGDNNNDFAISGSQLKSAKMFNYENKSSYMVRVRTTDALGLSFEKAFKITITNVAEINKAPVCSAATAVPSSLVANSALSFASIAINNVTDANNDNITIKIKSIRQDEPTRANSSDPTPDGQGVGTGNPFIRQQASATGNGRVYHVAFTATDVNGACCSCEVKVGVKPAASSATPKDGGSLHDSTR